MMYNNIKNLISESEEFVESKVISEILNDIKGSTKNYYKKQFGIQAAGTVGMTAGIGTMLSNPSSPVGYGLYFGGAAVAGLGSIAYAIYKYMTSYHRLSQKVTKVSDLLDNAKKNKDVAAIEKYSNKLNVWKNKLEKTKAHLREQNAHFIVQTKEMKDKLNNMKKNGSDKTAIDTLEKKIKEREAFISKIGAKV